MFFDFLFAYVTTFSGQLCFRRSYFFSLPQSNYFYITEESPLHSSYFFQNSYCFSAKLISSSHFLRIGRSLEKFHFETATRLEEELFRIKMSTEKLLFQSRCFCKTFFSEELNFGKIWFFIKQYPALSTFSGELSF